MNFPTIRIEGSILSPDILDKIEQGDITGQLPKDFGFDSKIKVKDEIARAWADANSQWKIYKSRIENVKETESGNSETRKFWIIPLLGFLGFDVELSKSSEVVNGKSYAISHKVTNLDSFPIHIMGFKDSLDKKRADSGPRMSPHSLIQEYINLTEHLFAIVTNGFLLRLLRDSSRLIKLSYIEFDLERMFEEEHYTDFALLYRLLHSSRMPKTKDLGPDSVIEKYHQDALDSGARIRDGLCNAVESSIKILGNGFLNNHSNTNLRDSIENGSLTSDEYHKNILRLIYRLLFLMVIEERGLVYPDSEDLKKKIIYYSYYSVTCLRNLCEKRFILNEKYNNYWIQLKNTFRLFESENYGKPLSIKPLAGDLFSSDAIGLLNNCELDNNILMQCFRKLSFYESEITNQIFRVNYAALNVEEFGSVYEGLLEYKPSIQKINGYFEYALIKGSERSSSGSHYTPDELVQPLIKHSLDYIIEDKLKEKDPENALLSITVCDVACGSGHILLNAARRIAVELAKVRTGEDQPSPSSFRHAIKDVIKNCIYGVDKNPLAVELCRIALWLESHNPGEPLNFLDHKIKCGDSILGLAHKEELLNGIPIEAFNRMPDDDKDICSELKKINKKEFETRIKKKQIPLDFKKSVDSDINVISSNLGDIHNLPETTPEEVETKKQRYQQLNSGADWWRLKNLADIQVAQFFIPKTEVNKNKLITDEKYYQLLQHKQILGEFLFKATSISKDKYFFHWFLEFPEIFEKGGFDCILGNPPFLGGQKISGIYGESYLSYLKFQFFPIGAVDLVTYFFRRIFNLINTKGFQSLISTNSISQGKAREDGLGFILDYGGKINHAIKSTRWPGVAAVEVALVSITKNDWKSKFILGNKEVNNITSFLDDSENLASPFILKQNEGKSFQGSIVLGKSFFVTEEEISLILKDNRKNSEIIFPFINGDDINSDPNQRPSRYVICFSNFEKDLCINNYKFPFEFLKNKLQNEFGKLKDHWWQFHRFRPDLYASIKNNSQCFVINNHTKHYVLSYIPSKYIYSHALTVFSFNNISQLFILSSSFCDSWAWKYGSTMGGTTLRYTPVDCFQTFPFNDNIKIEVKKELIRFAIIFHKFRNEIMKKYNSGLTNIYNLYHSKMNTNNTEITKLREFHIHIDNYLKEFYFCKDISLRHDFYEVDYLPENDRIRFTIHPDARKEILKRLLELNHKIHEEEVAAGLWDKKKTTKSKPSLPDRVSDGTGELFD